MEDHYCPTCLEKVKEATDYLKTLYMMPKEAEYVCLICMKWFFLSKPHNYNPNNGYSLHSESHSPRMFRETISQLHYGQTNGHENCHYLTKNP